MGSAASTDRAERRRRDRALEIPDDTEAAADVRKKGCKVSPDPKEAEETAPPHPGSPSFRIYCQDTARIDALVAASDAEDNSDEPARPMEMILAIRTNDPPHGSAELSKPKESSGWLNLRGQAIFDKVYGLLICRSKAASAHHPPHPPAAVAAKHHHSSAALPPRRPAPVPFI
uniref:Uncharacterized protein n=1 Tax=Avena sativa TaxID=4498 RepID=A0ACD5WJF3_AVESA